MAIQINKTSHHWSYSLASASLLLPSMSPLLISLLQVSKYSHAFILPNDHNNSRKLSPELEVSKLKNHKLLLLAFKVTLI